MTTDPRAALALLVSAFERHLEVSSTRRGEDDPGVVAAYDDLADAFEEYDSALYEAFGEMTPLDIYGADDDDADESDDDADESEDGNGGDSSDAEGADDLDDEGGDDGGTYAGLDDDEVDFEDDPKR